MGILTGLIHLSFKMCLLIDFPAHILSAFLQSIETDTQVSQLVDHLCVLWWSCDHVVEAGRWGGTAMRALICLLWRQGGQSVTLPWKRTCWSPNQPHKVREARRASFPLPAPADTGEGSHWFGDPASCHLLAWVASIHKAAGWAAVRWFKSGKVFLVGLLLNGKEKHWSSTPWPLQFFSL